jgi:aspartyl-tRNA(Asn)/glutamyl-tRNA(Gln) amidotransferase subunit C
VSDTSLDINKIAKLANLPLAEDEKQTFGGQLEDVIKYIEQLDKVDTSNVPPTFNTTGLTSVLQEDSIRPSITQEEALSNAPAKNNGLFVTNGIFSEE